jgi:hypothetical protein
MAEVKDLYEEKEVAEESFRDHLATMEGKDYGSFPKNQKEGSPIIEIWLAIFC